MRVVICVNYNMCLLLQFNTTKTYMYKNHVMHVYYTAVINK